MSRSTVYKLINGGGEIRSETVAAFLTACAVSDTEQRPWLAKHAELYPYQVREPVKQTPMPGPEARGHFTHPSRAYRDLAAGNLRPGRPIGQCDPLGLEVHRAIELPGQASEVPVLPVYVPRAHDARLGEVVAAAASGTSRLAVLVGESSTGKTRACWEAIQALPDPWRVWHPYDPSRLDAADRELGVVGPYTVIWLNEAQHYLLTTDLTMGERLAAGLRTLLADEQRAPVLILATMWRQYWSAATTRPTAEEPDLYPQTRELFDGNGIAVPDRFTGTDLQALRDSAAADPRLAAAASGARDGQITQHLAGVPELLARYDHAPPTARAILDLAIDARRLGHPPAIPHALLLQAAPGYLTDHEWNQASAMIGWSRPSPTPAGRVTACPDP